MKIIFLDQSIRDEAFINKLGGKASSLNRLSVAGFPVPAGFVIHEEVGSFTEAIEKIGGFPVAVRSSGSLEDLPNASFAGLYETFLFIRNHEELNSAIKNCFESKNSDRVVDYLKTKKIVFLPENLTMSVLVQKMVEAKIAGVLFTLNPTNGHEEECYIEFCEGVGERLVSGHVTPSRISYDWMKGQKIQEEVNSENTKLSESHLQDLVSYALKIQAYYGKPQDIEWAIGPDDKLYILQSRPVTTFFPREDRPEVTNADLKDGGVSARVCTQFMYSVYREAMKVSMGEYFKKINLIKSDENIQWIYYQYGRVYWNAGAVKEGLKKLPDFHEVSFDRDLGIQKDYGKAGPHVTSLNPKTLFSAIPVLIGLYKEFSNCELMIKNFRTEFEVRDMYLKDSLSKLAELSEDHFNEWFLNVIKFQNETEKNYFRTIYNNSNFQTEYKGFLKKLANYEVGDEVDLMGELHGVSHLDVQAGLAKLKEVADQYGFESENYLSSREEFLMIHYHHGPAELDLVIPRWGEKKDWVDDLVKCFVSSDSNKKSLYQMTFDRISKGLSHFKRKKFHKLTLRSREFLRLREEMRSYSTRAYYLLRLGILEFGRRESLSGLDVFMLDVQDIKSRLVDRGFILPDFSLTKLFYEGYRHFTPPNEFGGTIKAVQSSFDSGELKGLGCSPGEFSGRARVRLDIHATSDLTKDDILVTVFTDPGWTPVLARVGGVITEVGGILSHAAVIGREYGIPAILNLIDATNIIQDGDYIKVNGKTGVVEILEKSS